MQDPKSRQKSPSGHHPTTLSGYIFATKACIDNRKKTLSSNISPICLHNMVDFGPLAAEIVSLVWGTPGNFNGFRVLAELLNGTLVVGVRQTAAFNRGHHLYSARRPSRWTLAHISNCSLMLPGGQEPRLDIGGRRHTGRVYLADWGPDRRHDDPSKQRHRLAPSTQASVPRLQQVAVYIQQVVDARHLQVRRLALWVAITRSVVVHSSIATRG